MDWRALALAAVASACQRGPAPDAVRKPPPPTVVSAESLVAPVLASVHAKISLAAPPWQLDPLAFGAHLFAALTPQAVRVFTLPEGTLAFEAPLEGPRGVVGIAGGALLAAGAEEALRIEPHAKRPLALPPVPFLPGTLLLPERRDQGFVWAVQTAGRLLVKQRLERDPLRTFEAGVTLEGYDGGPITVLRDGSMLYRSPGGVTHALPEGHPHPLKTPFEVWRLLPGWRIDEAWAVAPDGRVELWVVTDTGLVVQKRFQAGAAPFDAAASSAFLALVLVDEPGDRPRSFRLAVFDNDGRKVFERALPPGPLEAGEDWEVRAVENRHVALGETEPYVAVGGPGNVEVLELPGGRRVLAR